MYERFTDRARKVMQLANQEAERLHHEYIGTEHILLGLVKEGSGVAANVLQNLDVDLRKLRQEVETIVQRGPEEMDLMGKLSPTPRAKKVCEYAIEEARTLQHEYVGTEHLLLGLLREKDGVGAQVLMNLGVKLEQVRAEVLALLGHGSETREPQKPASTRPANTPREELPNLPRQAVEALRELDAQLEELQRAKEEAVATENFEKAACLKSETETLKKQREELVQTWRGRKTQRIWEYEVFLSVKIPEQAEEAVKQVNQRLLEQFRGFMDLLQGMQGTWALVANGPTDVTRLFRVFSADPSQAILFFAQLKEEIRASYSGSNLVVLSREFEVL